MRNCYFLILIPAVLLVSACASSPNAADLDQKLRGMTKQQLFSCMGPPAASAKDGNMEFLTYSHRSIYDKYSYQCDANLVLTDGRVSKLNILGDAPGTLDVTSGVCRAMVAKCIQ